MKELANWEVNIINRLPHGLLVGWAYFTPDEENEEHNFYELNFYLLIIQLQFRWE